VRGVPLDTGDSEEDEEEEEQDLVCFVWRGFCPRFGATALHECARALLRLLLLLRVAKHALQHARCF
jgi:hypothetical protein